MAIIVFSFWGTAEMGDLVRGALQSIPAIQRESAQALGMNPFQVYTLVILPQTVRRLIPLSINLITRMVKTTSLVMMIGIVEVLKVARAIADRILFIENGTVVEQSDDPKAFFASPNTDWAKAFLKSFDYE